MKRLIIDVREPQEYTSSHHAEAINVPLQSLLSGVPETLKGIPKDTEVVVYCRSGSRSSMAKDILEKQGYTQVVNGVNQESVEENYT